MSAIDSKTLNIDLSKVNRSIRYDRNEIFQKEAFDIVIEKLNELVELKENDVSSDILMSRRHDTIFIDGERGTGKTAFLINIEKRIKGYDGAHEKGLLRQLAFLGPIDPTLLFDDENFLGVVLGTVVEAVNEKLEMRDFGFDDIEKRLNHYYKRLEEVSRSLKAVFELKRGEVSGVDAIASHASSKQLEQKAHLFFEAAAAILGKKVLALLIDDVDMAFDKGFDVLETIRKFLASPYIIPIVSGDANLYKYLIKKEFSFSIHYQNEKAMAAKVIDEFDSSELQLLVDQYFNKVMPNDRRIELKPVRQLRKQYFLQLIASNGKKMWYNQFKDFEIQLINYGINQGQFTSQVFPDNLRSFVQYLAKKRKIIEALPDNLIKNDDKEHTIYKPGKENELVNWLYTEKFDLFRQSLEATASFYRYSMLLEEKRISLMLENDLDAMDNGRLVAYKVFKGSFFQARANREERKEYASRQNGKRVFCKLEKELLSVIYFQKATLSSFLKEDKCKSIEKAVTRLFAYDNYYNESSSTRAYFVTGKFIEALLYSFDLKDVEKKEAEKKFNEIANSRPFNLGIDDNHINDNPEEEDEESYPEKLFDESVCDEVYGWYDEYIDKKNEAIKYSLTTNRMHEILHKFFNNVNALKEHNKIGLILRNDSYDSFIARICAILLNAVAFFERDGSVEESNIAMGEGRFDYERLQSKSNPIRKNLEPLKKDSANNRSLTFVLSEHPFIKTFLTEKTSKEDICEGPTLILDKLNTEESEFHKIKSKFSQRYKIKIENLNEENVSSYLNEIKGTNNRKFIKYIVGNFEKNGTLEYKMKEKKIPAALDFYKKNKDK